MPQSFNTVYQNSIQNPEAFWGEAAEQLHWYKKWNKVLDTSNPPFDRWFAGGITNTCYNALDRHVDEGRGNQLAVIYDSPVTGTKQRYTYREFRDIVALFAGALQSRGVRKGDRIIIYMPMIPEAVVAMLACARIGAILLCEAVGKVPAGNCRPIREETLNLPAAPRPRSAPCRCPPGPRCRPHRCPRG